MHGSQFFMTKINALYIPSLVSPSARLTEVSINQTYEQGQVATLECNSTGGPGNTYQWQRDGEDVQNGNSTILILLGVTDATGGVYSCIVSNAAGNHSASTFLFVSPYFLEQPVEVILTSAESSFNVSCLAAAFPPPEYQWGRLQGKEIRMEIIANESILAVSSVQFGDEGSYYCIVTSNGLNISRTSLITSKETIMSLARMLFML